MKSTRRGATMVVALVTLLVVMLVAATLLRSMIASYRRQRLYQNELQAQWLAEAAIDRAVIRRGVDESFTRETWKPAKQSPEDEAGVAEIRVEPVAGQAGAVRIVVNAHFPDHPTRRVSVHREITLELKAAAADQPTTPGEGSR